MVCERRQGRRRTLSSRDKIGSRLEGTRGYGLTFENLNGTPLLRTMVPSSDAVTARKGRLDRMETALIA
jgi:hypothetical protein